MLFFIFSVIKLRNYNSLTLFYTLFNYYNYF